MGLLLVIVRRALWLVLISAIGGAAYAYWRDRNVVEPAGPPEWPPLPIARAGADTDGRGLADAAGDSPTNSPANSAASFVNALVDAPEARSSDGVAGGWVAPDDDGSCPLSHPVKANDNSGIFHMPGGRFYERTKAERCYQSADAALADGYRQAKN